MNHRIVYTLGRILAVTTRPVCLFAANNYIGTETAQGLAVGFLASTLGLIIATGAPYRRYYAGYFSAGATNGVGFYIYGASLLMLGCLGSAFVFLIGIYFGGSPLLAGAIMVYFVSEKLADEVLRFKLFEEKFGTWGLSNVVRSTVQLAAVGVLAELLGRRVSAQALLLTMAGGTFLALGRYVPYSLWSSLPTRRPAIHHWLWRRAFKSLIDDRLLWVIVVTGALVGNTDRVLVLFVDQTVLPIFTLVVMSFSILLMTIDYYYLSQYRRSFLSGRITIVGALTSRSFRQSFAIGLVLSVVACTAVLVLSKGGGEFDLRYVLAVAGLQVAVAVGTIPREIVFWSKLLNSLLRIETWFWLVFCGAATAIYLLSWPSMILFAVVVSCAFMRLFAYVYVARRAVPQEGRGAAST